MTTIAVIGATGTAGLRVTARLNSRDVAVVEVSRAHGTDLVSGQGLPEALKGVDTVIDVSNPMPGPPPTVTASTRPKPSPRPPAILWAHARRRESSAWSCRPSPASTTPNSTDSRISRPSRKVRGIKPASTPLGVGGLLAPDHAVVLGPDVDPWLDGQATDRVLADGVPNG